MTVDNINRMIDYCIKMPEKDEYEVGHRYPYYSCELLCSINGLNIDRLLEMNNEEIINNKNDEYINKNETKEEIDLIRGKTEEDKEKEEKEEKNEENKEKKETINENDDNNNEQNKNTENSQEEDNKNSNELKNNILKEFEINDNSKENINETKEKKEDSNNKENKIEEEQNKAEDNEIDGKNEENTNINKSNTENQISKKEETSELNKEEQEKDEENKIEIEEPEQVESEIKKLPNISLVYSVFDHIFSFLDNKLTTDNTVLSGYFNKIVNYLIKTKTRITLEYILLHRTDLISKLIANINKISISNIISNILNALTEENSPEANEKYMIIINECINFIGKKENNFEDDINSVELICDLFINHIIYNNKIKFSKIIDANIITKFEQIMNKLFDNYEQNLQKILSIINLLTKMNKSLLSNFAKKITSTKNSDDTKIEMLNLINSIDRTSNQYISFTTKKNDFKELLYSSFLNNYISYCNAMNNICLSLINNKIKQIQNNNSNKTSILMSYSEQPKEVYKLSNLIELDFIVSLIDIYVNLFNVFFEDENKSEFIKEKINQINSTNFFRFMLYNYLNYRNNNFLTNIMLDLIKITFDNNIAPKELVLNILQFDSNNQENNNNLISLLINDLVNNTKFFFENSNNKSNNLLFSNNVLILRYIFSSPNLNVLEFLNKMDKEKFFYKYFITNVYNIYSKKLYKTDSVDSAVDKINSLGIRLGFGNTLTQSNTNIAFSVVSINNTIDFYLKIYDKYLKGEEYEYLFDERIKELEEIKKSSEYLKLNKQIEDELEDEEDEDDDINEFNIPKPTFYNSKLEEKNNENEEKDNITTDSDNTDDNDNENKLYNDVNYWHIEIKDENMEDLLKDL